jgi:rubrerythrin
MGKGVGPKEAARRALRAQAVSRPRKTANPSVAPSGGVSAHPDAAAALAGTASLWVCPRCGVHGDPASHVCAPTEPAQRCPTCGRFRVARRASAFDKRAYMREYMRKRRKAQKAP